MIKSLKIVIYGCREFSQETQVDKGIHNMIKAVGMQEGRQGRFRTIGKEQERFRDLGAERTKQIGRFMMLNFHRQLGMQKDEYLASFPFLSDQEAGYKGRFDIPLFIDPRLSLKRQCQQANIVPHINTDRIYNDTSVPNKPYVIWTHDANPHRLDTSDKGIYFKDDEVGSPLIEVINLYIQHPEFFKDHGAEALGSRYTDGHRPYLDIIRGWPRIYTSWAIITYERWGALTRGKEIQVAF